MKTSQRGFTLLELLLVVGIAAILIIAGITTYSLVNKNNTVNETIRLVNTILDKARNLYSGQATYGAVTFEAALVTTGSLPAKYVLGTTDITTPYSSDANAVTVIGGGATGAFTVTIDTPAAYAAEIGAAFDPNSSTEITTITVCGLTIPDGTAYNIATVAARAQCQGMAVGADLVQITSR